MSGAQQILFLLSAQLQLSSSPFDVGHCTCNPGTSMKSQSTVVQYYLDYSGAFGCQEDTPRCKAPFSPFIGSIPKKRGGECEHKMSAKFLSFTLPLPLYLQCDKLAYFPTPPPMQTSYDHGPFHAVTQSGESRSCITLQCTEAQCGSGAFFHKRTGSRLIQCHAKTSHFILVTTHVLSEVFMGKGWRDPRKPNAFQYSVKLGESQNVIVNQLLSKLCRFLHYKCRDARLLIQHKLTYDGFGR